jgi:N-acetylneuraminate synthase
MKNIFENLFVLEVANNHWGNVERGLKIIESYAHVIKSNNVKAAIKLQFRDVNTFIHEDFKDHDIRYIQKTLATKMDDDDYSTLISFMKKKGFISMSTPFDERSVELCVELGIDIIKIASSDIKDKILIKNILKSSKPVIVSTGGASLEDIDNVVNLFNENDIPLAINHCVALYPSEKTELQLNQIDLLKKHYPNNVIGFSTHEFNENIDIPIMIAYAKGARTFERHVDIDYNNIPVSPYCSLPTDVDKWIKGYKKAVEICGSSGEIRRDIPCAETEYLNALVRGVYAKKDLSAGEILNRDNTYLAIPLQKGQISSRELEYSEKLTSSVSAHEPIKINNINGTYSNNKELEKLILKRGI